MSQLTFDVFGGASMPDEHVSIVTDQKPAEWYKGRALSHSSMSTYLTCPQKWKFRYIDKIPEKPRSVFSFGKSVHTGLEFLFTRIGETLPTLEEMLAHFK